MDNVFCLMILFELLAKCLLLLTREVQLLYLKFAQRRTIIWWTAVSHRTKHQQQPLQKNKIQSSKTSYEMLIKSNYDYDQFFSLV